MKQVTRMIAVLALTFGIFHAAPASATTSEPGYDFCYKRGDYYDSDGVGYHVIECVNLSWGGGAFMDIYYIKHGVEFRIYQT